MMVRYEDFVNFGRVDDPDDWMPGVRIRPDGIYMDEPPRSPIEAVADERAAQAAGHPTGNLLEPVITFPCDLRALGKVLDGIGAAGRIDAFDMAEWLLKEGHAGSRWPWGNYETKLLRHMADAARRYWKYATEGGPYVPSERDTAPTNEVVANFLTERGVPSNTATAMATILRSDDVPKGRRRGYSDD